MSKLRNFREFLDEKKSPYKKATLLKYKRKWEDGEEIPFGIENSLKAQGMIPRADGEIRKSGDYDEDSSPEKKKVIKESFEDTMSQADITLSFTCKNGKTLEIKEIEGTGMVGESMTFAYIFHDGKLTTKEKIKNHLKPAEYKELSNYLNDITDNNEASAVSIVK